MLDLIQYSNYLAFTFSKKNAHYKEHTRHYLSLPHISALWLTANKSSWFISKANANIGRWWEEDGEVREGAGEFNSSLKEQETF